MELLEHQAKQGRFTEFRSSFNPLGSSPLRNLYIPLKTAKNHSEQAAYFTVEGVRDLKRRISAERLAQHDTERDRAARKEAQEKAKDESNQQQSNAGADGQSGKPRQPAS